MSPDPRLGLISHPSPLGATRGQYPLPTTCHPELGGPKDPDEGFRLEASEHTGYSRPSDKMVFK